MTQAKMVPLDFYIDVYQGTPVEQQTYLTATSSQPVTKVSEGMKRFRVTIVIPQPEGFEVEELPQARAVEIDAE